jgi:tRNA A37 threonylcarbamoyladenosine dehydratase
VQDELLRQVRRKLRRDFDFPRDRAADFGIRCVYSPEKPVYPWADGTCQIGKEPGTDLALDCASGFGTASFVTAPFGFAAAGEVVRHIALG